MVTAVETDSALSSRDSLTLRPALSSRSSMSGQLRLEMIHLTRGDIDDFWTMKSNSFGKSAATHSSSASMIKEVLVKLGSCRMFVKISDKANQAFASSKRALPAWSYFFRI